MFFRKSHAKVQIIFDMCKYHQFISQISSIYFTNIINLFHDIIIFGIYIPVDPYMILLERGREFLSPFGRTIGFAVRFERSGSPQICNLWGERRVLSL